MKTKSRGGASINVICLHDPEGANTARELVNYLNGIDAGYHVCVDDNELIVAADDGRTFTGGRFHDNNVMGASGRRAPVIVAA